MLTKETKKYFDEYTQHAFTSPLPEVKLVNIFDDPYNNAIATARTCYSAKGIVTSEQTAKKPQLRDKIADSIFKAGHHTTIQHCHVQFQISNISRHCVWSFLHAHQFYNSEQTSQRYCKVAPSAIAVPAFDHPDFKTKYLETVEFQMKTYHELIEDLKPIVASQYYKIFPHRPDIKRWRKVIEKKAMEIARYVLPISTFTSLYHTVSFVTLLRYYKTCFQENTSTENYIVAHMMMLEVLKVAPELERFVEPMLSSHEMPEELYSNSMTSGDTKEYLRIFDSLQCGKLSRLADYQQNAELTLANAARSVLGISSYPPSDKDIIELVMNPAKNKMLSTTMNTTMMSNLCRSMHHVHYTFKKRISHTADSQDQRHRTTPASRPVLYEHVSRNNSPDYITPKLIMEDAKIHRKYDEAMEKIWEGFRNVHSPFEDSSYLLPNALTIRYYESGDLLGLYHKYKMRLCYNAQEEIWQASKEEVEAITAVHPNIGKWLLPPCGVRNLAGAKPICPEGDRYCGVPVWKKDITEYERLI
jgi:flavin-dependent thymidylate synthase